MQIKSQGYPVQVDANKNRYSSELSKSGFFREIRTLNFIRMKKSILFLLSLASISVISCNSTVSNKKNGEMKGVEVTQTIGVGWQYLFDGTSTEGWRGYNNDSFPTGGWIIDEGALRCVAGAQGGDIIFDKKFSNFELSFEWKISEAGNSGVFILSQEVPEQAIYMSSPEFQILDNDKHPDAKLGRDGNRTASSLYDLIPANPQNSKPVGEWNSAGIIVNKGKVTHIHNGAVVVEYEIWTDQWRAMVADSKFKDWPNFVNPAKEGYIGFQDHGNDVWFRNIKIREL